MRMYWKPPRALQYSAERSLPMTKREVERASASTPLSLTTVTEARPLFAGYPSAGSMMCQ